MATEVINEQSIGISTTYTVTTSTENTVFPHQQSQREFSNEPFRSSARQPKMMVNGNMSDDLVQLVPDARDRHKQQSTSPSSWKLTTSVVLKRGYDKGVSSALGAHKNERSKNKSVYDFHNGDARSVIDVPLCKNQGSIATNKRSSTNNNSNSNNNNNNKQPQAKPTWVRSQSTPGPDGALRRTLFDSFWKKGEKGNLFQRCHSGSSSDSFGASARVSASCEGDQEFQAIEPPRKNLSRSQSDRIHSGSSSASASPSSHRRNYQVQNSPGCRESSINIMRFSPPPKHASTLRSRFEDLHELPDSLQQLLPPLPSPLSRICHSDGSLSSCGVYPLLSPKSILQKSSFGASGVGPECQTAKQRNGEGEGEATYLSPGHAEECLKKNTIESPSPTMIMALPLSLTDSMRHMNARDFVEDPRACRNDVEASDDTSSSLSTSMNQRVHFDPRVTISEYDDHAPRQWYTDTDLDRFKIETIALAQRYLLHHPDVAAEYCVGKIDPITGCVRKKTLYSLPILNHVSIHDDECDTNKDSCRSNESSSINVDAAISCDYTEKARTHVQKILVVDPNTLIQELFRKSLLQIFPHAEVTVVQTGEEALVHTKRGWSQSSPTMSPRSFDIIIIEERLRLFTAKRSPVCSPQQIRADGRNGNGSIKHASVTTIPSLTAGTGSELFQPKFLSGSDVIAKLKQLEADVCRPDRCIMEDEELVDLENSSQESDSLSSGQPGRSSREAQGCWRPLVVGVCVDQKHDAVKLWQNGCDLVWPKPPPPMGQNVRNQLVSLLVKKRSVSLIPSGYHQELNI